MIETAGKTQEQIQIQVREYVCQWVEDGKIVVDDKTGTLDGEKVEELMTFIPWLTKDDTQDFKMWCVQKAYEDNKKSVTQENPRTLDDRHA